MDAGSLALLILGCIGITLTIIMAACGYGKPAYDEISRTARKAISATRRFMKRR